MTKFCSKILAVRYCFAFGLQTFGLFVVPINDFVLFCQGQEQKQWNWKMSNFISVSVCQDLKMIEPSHLFHLMENLN